jgi:hypothetical protein
MWEIPLLAVFPIALAGLGNRMMMRDVEERNNVVTATSN